MEKSFTPNEIVEIINQSISVGTNIWQAILSLFSVGLTKDEIAKLEEQFAKINQALDEAYKNGKYNAYDLQQEEEELIL